MPVVLAPTPDALQRAAAALRGGGLVGFPTETVYGLGADAADPAAVRAVFRVKRRPLGHPLIVHLDAPAAVHAWAAAVPDDALALIEAFWPGPLTLILPCSSRVDPQVTGGQTTVGLRMPAHPVAQALLAEFGGALVAPSANRFGRVSPTLARHVADEFATSDEPRIVLDGGASAVGLESTILDLSGPEPTLLRPGAVTAGDIARVLGRPPRPPGADSPRAPGRLERHYAPTTPTRLLPRERIASALAADRDRLGVLAFAAPIGSAASCRLLPADPARAGRLLYAHLRELDAAGLDAILVETPPAGADWEAVRDRLRKASAGHAAGDPDPIPTDPIPTDPIPTDPIPTDEEER